MSAIAALKGYRTQFLYSLHYILSNKEKNYRFRLEGEEDLDVLDEHSNLLIAVQVKNLAKTLTLTDVLSDKKTSFLKRFIENYQTSTPLLVSYGIISDELLNWKSGSQTINTAERVIITKYDLTTDNWKLIKQQTVFEKVDEGTLAREVLEMLKTYKNIDPVPTAENLLYWLQYSAEKQIILSSKDLFMAIEKMAVYLSERISFENQYGKYIKALHLTKTEGIDQSKLTEEFYYGTNARYEHIYFNLDIIRPEFLNQIDENLKKQNLVVIRGASGQGKSALAYRYAANYAPTSLIYEVALQENETQVAEAISAITAMTKGLNLPVFFILHVAPNTTNWLKVVKEFTNHTFVRMLVTVRNEDWYRAQAAEIDFLYTEIELELQQAEAEFIFKKLESREMIRQYADFKEAWIDLNENIPLLEFTYTITQGDSLTNRLKKQVDQLYQEDNQQKTGQLDFLKMLSLADAFGAKIAVEKIRQIPGIKFITDKFEKEYLLKHVEEGKYLTGLHPVRSKILTGLLFDDFTSCKKDYILACLRAIPDEDAYSFLLQCFYTRIIKSDEFIKLITDADSHTWTFYASMVKSLLWEGIRNYVDANKDILDEVHQKTGAAWSIVADIYHGSTLDIEELIKSLPMDNDGLLDYARDIKERLLPKQLVYQPVVSLFNAVPLPVSAPKSIADWKAFAEIIFWLSQTDNKVDKTQPFLPKDFRAAFETLSLEDLASLMLGMYYYSPAFNQIRLDFVEIFTDRIRKKYCIPLLKISDEIHVDFVIDLFDKDKDINVHDRTIEIIELLRTAFPDKQKFNSQGHGHRIQLMTSAHDETHKTISLQNLPLDKWVSINATVKRLYDFSCRPEDWVDFHYQLDVWEKTIKDHIQTFNNAFQELRQSSTFKPIVPVLAQAVLNHTQTLTTPKSIVDPLGLYIKTSKNAKKEEDGEKGAKKEVVLSERYQPFFKNYSDYKNALENFLQQSGIALSDLIKNRSDATHLIDENNLRVSYVNIYDAITKRPNYYRTKLQYFSKFFDANHAITDTDLFTAATIWKTFWPAAEKGQNSKIITKQKIDSSKVDFENALSKSFKAIQRTHGYKVNYINDESSLNTPVFILTTSNPIDNLVALQLYFDAIHACINGVDYSSLKFLMLQRYFSRFRFIGLVNGFVMDYQWYDFSLHLLRDHAFGDLPFYALIPQPIDKTISNTLNIKSWLHIYPKLQEVLDLGVNFAKLNFLVGHLVDLKFFDHNDDLDEIGAIIIQDHFNKVGEILTTAFNQFSNALLHLGEEFPYDEVHLLSEAEQEYWTLLLDVMDNILPTPANESRTDESTTRFDMPVLEPWSARLNTAFPKWGVFMIYLQHKCLTERNK
jgi:hypothetical protein